MPAAWYTEAAVCGSMDFGTRRSTFFSACKVRCKSAGCAPHACHAHR